MKTAYFAGGCFWCITPTFRQLPGVAGVTSGYCGGREENPSYEDVKYQRTGHRETVRIDYDPMQVSYGELLEIFLSGVDPFDEGGQFIDRGHSYTLAVFYSCEQERHLAADAVTRLEADTGRKAFISLEPFTCFYTAGEEHQDYDRKNPEAFRQELIDSGRLKL